MLVPGHHPVGPGRIGDCAMGLSPDAPLCLIPGQRVDLNSIIGEEHTRFEACKWMSGRVWLSTHNTIKNDGAGESVMLQDRRLHIQDQERVFALFKIKVKNGLHKCPTLDDLPVGRYPG